MLSKIILNFIWSESQQSNISGIFLTHRRQAGVLKCKKLLESIHPAQSQPADNVW